MFKPFFYCFTLSLQALLTFGQTKPVIVGNNKDSHGCIPSAGYTYSTVKKECIRVFEQKIQLTEINPKGSSVSICAVIFNESNTLAEVFLPEYPKSVILKRTGRKGGYVWKKGNLSLLPWKGYVLKRGNTVIYGGA